ncbi:hypothetical protein [Actinomadura meridiana]|uniref:hypothetical protein n=1 Tax=Actinomadura meridiana TaxID=559626 RepID=UPI0031EE9163
MAPPLDARELVREFTEVAAKLIGERGPAPLAKEQVSAIVRQAVFAALRDRKRHHAQIIELDRLVRRETSNRRLRERLPGWLARTDLSRVDVLDSTTKDLFTVLNPDDGGDCVRVVHPAYVDTGTGALVQSGQLRIGDHDLHAKKSWCVLLEELTAGAEEVTGSAEGD